jgi:hypothetical protein
MFIYRLLTGEAPQNLNPLPLRNIVINGPGYIKDDSASHSMCESERRISALQQVAAAKRFTVKN